MVCSVKVVVDGFGNAYNVDIVARLSHILAYFVAGIHTVVAAVIEEIPYVVLFEYF